MTETKEDRDAVLRRLLVATATADSAASNRAPRWLVVLLAGLAVAGFGTAGAVTAVALAPSESASDSEPDAGQFVDQMASLGAYAVGSSHTALGEPITLQGTGTTSIDLGVPPAGASGVAMVIACSGDYVKIAIAVDGEEAVSFTCSKDGDATGTQVDIPAADPTLTVETSATFSISMTWVTPVSRRSAEQTAELADGVVTEQEYRAAFQRFATCMADAGYPLLFINDAGPVIQAAMSDAAKTSGVEAECYLVEFQDVDMTWQLSQEQ